MDTKDIEKLIREYHWRKKEVKRLEDILFSVKSSNRSVGVAQYGIEATLPKPNTNIKSHAEMDEMDAREKRLLKRYERFKSDVETVEKMADYLTNDKHLVILDCMMEGMSYRFIARHLSISETKLWQMRSEMIGIIQKEQKEQIEQYEHV